MSMPVASMIFQCFFNPPPGTAAYGIPSIKLPVPIEVAQSLAAFDPPLNKTAFIGENGPLKEWVFGNSSDPLAAQMKLLRVQLTEKPLASPYEARLGTATKQVDGNYAFSIEMAGYCDLKSVDPSSGNSQ